MVKKLNYPVQVLELCRGDLHKFPLIISLFVVQSFLELIGLGLVAPYISLIANPDSLWFDNIIRNYLKLDVNVKELHQILGVGLILAFLLKFLVAYLTNRKVIHFVQSKRCQLATTLLKNYQNMTYEAYSQRNSAEYTYRIQTLTYQFAEQTLAPILRIFGDGLIAITLLIFLCIYNTIAFLLLVLLLASIVGTFDFFTKRLAKANGFLANKYSTNMLKTVAESMNGFKELRVLGKQDYFYNRASQNAENFSQVATAIQLIGILPRYLLEFVLVLFIVLLITFGPKFGIDRESLISTIGVFGIASMRLLPIANGLSASLVGLRYSRNSVSLLYEDCIGHKRQNQKNPDDLQPITEGNLFERIVVDSVSHKYLNSKRSSINNVSLEIRRGEAVGFIGASGSGKTTLIDSMLALINPSEGSLSVNGIRLTTPEAIRSWQNLVAYLPQKVFLVDDTIRNNIALGVDESFIDDARIQNAIHQAKLSTFIDSLPDELNTAIGEGGVRISGGQAQRIALARAFYHGRDILVMDESTSALDHETEEEILDQVMSLKGNKTLIIIAHRLSTLARCDKIYKLENGSIISFGSYDDVIKQKS